MVESIPTHNLEEGSAPSLPSDQDYWNQLVNEEVAADFLGLHARTLQLRRQQGGGPIYVVISARCIRYRRCDLKAWADGRVRTSTSDRGQEAA